MRHLNKPLRRCSLAIVAVGLALCLAIPASAKPPSWDKRIDGKGRFKVLKAFDDETVLDKETGLVWARVPFPDPLDWDSANNTCLRLPIGGRGGWRLPRYEERVSLINPGTQALPDEHPFDAPESSSVFWSATTTITNAGTSGSAMVIRLGKELSTPTRRRRSSTFAHGVCAAAEVSTTSSGEGPLSPGNLKSWASKPSPLAGRWVGSVGGEDELGAFSLASPCGRI